MKFETGKTYMTRSVCDHNSIVRVTVAKRTAKTITTAAGKTLRVSEYRGVEQVKPYGSYSMAPIVGADDTRELLTDWEAKAKNGDPYKSLPVSGTLDEIAGRSLEIPCNGVVH